MKFDMEVEKLVVPKNIDIMTLATSFSHWISAEKRSELLVYNKKAMNLRFINSFVQFL